MDDSLIFAGIAPHPPLLVPSIGGQRIDRVRASAAALKEFSQRLLACAPETVVLISPHSPGDTRYFGAFSDAQLQGSFYQFGAAQVGLQFANDLTLLDQLQLICQQQQLPFQRFASGCNLDHGVLVPMYYLHQAGWQGPLVALSFTALSNQDHLDFGQAISHAAARINRRIAFVASADLSHYLNEESPYHFEPMAHLFDEQVCAAVRDHNLPAIVAIDQNLRQRAGECGYRSILVAIGAVGGNSQPQLLCYEGPFGVGYLTAILKEKR